MLKAATIAVLVALAAGCAGNARPVGPTDVPVRDDVPAGMAGETGGTAELPTEAVPVATRADLLPLPLPEGVRPDDFDIALQYNRRIAYWLDYYQKYHTTFGTWLERMSRYEPLIRRELTDAGLPGDLIYLALIESGFTPNATSSARAVGIWQFMKETARLEGLEVSTYIDERRDPVKATAAAVHHLRSLYRELGSWYLVAAAYNSGSGRVARALDASAGGARGADSLFWSIEPGLPRETRDYVPQFVAASIVAKYPDRFGVAPESVPGPDDYETVRISQATDLAAVARAARVSEDIVRRLNPQFFLGVTPPGRTVSVRVPAGHIEGLQKRLAAMPRRERVHDLRYTVERSETPAEIASEYGIELAALRKANHLKKKTRVLAEGRVLVIPLVPASVLAREQSASGDRLASTSSRERATGDQADDAPRAAGAKGGRAGGESAGRDREPRVPPDAVDRSTEGTTPGRQVARRHRDAGASPDDGDSAPSVRHYRTYRVKPGDNLADIADANGLDVAELRDLNSLRKGAVLHPGDELKLPRRLPETDSTQPAAEKPASRARDNGRDGVAKGSTSNTYRVRPGDTLWHIASEHGLTVERLRALNGMTADAVLQPGRILKVTASR